jgi:hypothetical protein
MPERKKRPALDEADRRVVLALISIGCSRRMAARYVGCSPTTIARSAARDAGFARSLGEAECGMQVAHLKNIHRAAKKDQYWRAAAWMLERLSPQDFAPRRADAITLAQVKRLVAELAEAIVEQVPERYHRRVLGHLRRLASGLGPGKRGET